MGQKCCCRPSTLKDPKHTLLLNLIYSEAQQNVKILDYDEIKQYFAKKGYIKTLCDYLSSHLNQISPTVLFCKNKEISVRTKAFTLQLLFGCATTEILQKIVALYLQISLKTSNKNRSNLALLEEKEQLSTKILESQNKKGQEKQTMQQSSKVKQFSGFKIQASSFSFIKDEINSTILETTSQLMKQTITIKNEKNNLVNDKAKLKKMEEIEFRILMTVQGILVKILEQQENFSKANYIVVRDILNSFIDIMVMCQKPAEKMSQKSNIIKIGQPLGLSGPNTLRTFLKTELENVDVQPNKQIKGQPQSVGVFSFTQNEKDVQQMRKMSLENYYKVIKKANLHLANANFYKAIVKVHMPLLLEHWASLMLQNDRYMSRLSQLSEQKGQGMDSEQEEINMGKQRNIKIMDHIIQQIILEFFNCYFSFRQSQYIYRELMRIFDRLNFNRLKIAPIQKLVFHSLRNYDLKQSVISKWFDYQLNYLGAVITISSNNSKQNDSFYTEKKGENEDHGLEQANYLADMNQNLNLVYQNYDYVSWFKEENIVGCLRTVNKWIQSKHVNIEDILTYKHTKLLVVVLSNLAWGSPQINDEIYKLIQLLILNDIRTFGHLVNTAISFINKLKIPNNSLILGEQNWDFFIQNWEKRSKIARTGDQQPKNQKQNTQRMKSSSPVFRSTKKNSLQGVQLISVQNFMDEIISIASYPFLNQILRSKVVEAALDYQTDLLKRRHSTNLQHNNPQLTQFKKTESFITIQEEEESKDVFEQKGQQISTSRSYKNLNLCLSVFQETLDILFKDLDLQNAKIRSSNQIKLSGLVLASNLKSMVNLIEKLKQKKDYIFSFHAVSNINKFLAKVYREVKNLSSFQEIFSSKVNQEKQSQSHDINQLQMSRDLELHRDSIDRKTSYTDLRTKKTLLNFINLWIYPALSFILSEKPVQIDGEQNENIEYLDEISGCSEFQLKILLSTATKLYFRNLVKVAKESLQNLQRNNLMEQPKQSMDMPNPNKKSNRDSKIINKRQSRQFEQSKEPVIRSYIPLIQIYEIFTEFYSRYQVAQTLRLKKQKIKSVRIIQSQSDHRRHKKFKSQIYSKKIKTPNLKQKEKPVSDKLIIQQFGENIKVSLKSLKAYDENLRNSKIKIAETENSKMKKHMAEGIQNVQEIIISNQSVYHQNNDGQVIKQSKTLIFGHNLCHFFFFLVDAIIKDDITKLQPDISQNNDLSWQTIIQNYLMKGQDDKISYQGMEISNKCQIFGPAKEKLNTVAGKQNQEEQKFTPPKQKLKETSHTDGTQCIRLNKQNFIHLMPQLIANLQSKYSSHTLPISNRKLEKDSSSSKLDYFNLGENQFKIQQSAVDSSELKSRTIEGNSFNQVMSDIRKH